MLILDTNENIFGGFTRAKWETPRPIGSEKRFADDTLTSFLFTLHNSHNTIPMKFRLKTGPKSRGLVIGCNYWNDMGNIYIGSWGFGSSYTNDTGLDGET
jgi:hypothetical protein